jgi:hypothetical protein
MKRGKRIAFTVAATGLAVVLGLSLLHWGTVRDHAEAWWFQATNETGELWPTPGLKWCLPCPFKDLADQSGHPVIIPTNLDMDNYGVDGFELMSLRKAGFRIVEQRFPRTAYVVIPPNP